MGGRVGGKALGAVHVWHKPPLSLEIVTCRPCRLLFLGVYTRKNRKGGKKNTENWPNRGLGFFSPASWNESVQPCSGCGLCNVLLHLLGWMTLPFISLPEERKREGVRKRDRGREGREMR